MVRKVENIREGGEEDLIETPRPADIPYTQMLEALLDGSTPFPARYLYRLSDLDDEELNQLHKIWREIPLWRRQALMEDLQVLVEKDLMLSFEAVARLALLDSDAKVRFGAIETLMANECEAPDLVDVFLKSMDSDPDRKVRAISTSALGRFVYLAEMEELSPEVKQLLENRLLQAVQGNEDIEIRCCALEALGFSTREEIPTLIENAYNAVDTAMQTSALIAMGRSGSERWRPQVMSMLNHANPSIRTEAARAAGELGMSESRPHLFDLVDDANPDVSMASLEALSKIGGKGVRKILQERLQEADDDDEVKFIEDLIDDLDFNEGIHDMDLIDLEEDGRPNLYTGNEGEDDDEIDADELFDFDDDEEDEEDDFYDEIDEEDLDDFLSDEDEDYDYKDDEEDEDLWD